MISLLLPLTLLLLISPSSSSRVLELSDRFLDIRKEGVWLVKFYAPWCGHCKKLEPVYNHVAQALHDTPIRVGRVDCTRFPSVGKEFGVQGFPTIIFIKPSSSHTYTGDRSSADLISYARKMMGPAVREWEELLEEDIMEDEVYLLFSGRKDSDLFNAFSTVADANQHSVGFFYKGGDEGEVITLHHRNQRALVYHPEDTTTPTQHHLQSFLTSHKFPKYPKITRNNFQDVMATRKLIALAVVEEDKLGRVMETEQVEFLQIFKDFVDETNIEGLQFGWTPHPDIANSIAMATLKLPTLLLINSTTHTHHIFPPSSHRTTPTMLGQFLGQVLNNELPPLGGSSLSTRLYRTYYELTTNLGQMFQANPVLTSLMFGLPLGFLSLIFYSICCSDILDGEEGSGGGFGEGEEDEGEELHEKRE